MGMLKLENSWIADGHSFVRWSSLRQGLLVKAKTRLNAELRAFLSRRCSHIQGHDGVKGSIHYAKALSNRYRYVARFDIRSYYESMSHAVLFNQLQLAGLERAEITLVREYLDLPDHKRTGCGMVAGGAISPLLAAVYLTPLDRAMEEFELLYGI